MGRPSARAQRSRAGDAPTERPAMTWAPGSLPGENETYRAIRSIFTSVQGRLPSCAGRTALAIDRGCTTMQSGLIARSIEAARRCSRDSSRHPIGSIASAGRSHRAIKSVCTQGQSGSTARADDPSLECSPGCTRDRRTLMSTSGRSYRAIKSVCTRVQSDLHAPSDRSALSIDLVLSRHQPRSLPRPGSSSSWTRPGRHPRSSRSLG
jgi:hypothetical protein